jgi:hypothetical protein
MPPEIVNLIGQMGMAGIFFYLYWRADQRLQEQGAKHDQDIARLYDMRIQELKQMARLPTDLTGDYTMPQKTA